MKIGKTVLKLKRKLTSAGLLIIDPQHAFTAGTWMNYFGKNEVTKIKTAFSRCSKLLHDIRKYNTDFPIIFTKCPFSGNSWEFDKSLKFLASKYEFVTKPGNSILYSYDFIKFDKWVHRELLNKKDTKLNKKLVIGGCTLNSCVRVTAMDVLKSYEKYDLKVVVDLSLCGARDSNYKKTWESDSKFDGLSPVDHAIKQMKEKGVEITKKFDFFENVDEEEI